jgi:hypothetical protein
MPNIYFINKLYLCHPDTLINVRQFSVTWGKNEYDCKGIKIKNQVIDIWIKGCKSTVPL